MVIGLNKEMSVMVLDLHLTRKNICETSMKDVCSRSFFVAITQFLYLRKHFFGTLCTKLLVSGSSSNSRIINFKFFNN